MVYSRISHIIRIYSIGADYATVAFAYSLCALGMCVRACCSYIYMYDESSSAASSDGWNICTGHHHHHPHMRRMVVRQLGTGVPANDGKRIRKKSTSPFCIAFKTRDPLSALCLLCCCCWSIMVEVCVLGCVIEPRYASCQFSRCVVFVFFFSVVVFFCVCVCMCRWLNKWVCPGQPHIRPRFL